MAYRELHKVSIHACLPGEMTLKGDMGGEWGRWCGEKGGEGKEGEKVGSPAEQLFSPILPPKPAASHVPVCTFIVHTCMSSFHSPCSPAQREARANRRRQGRMAHLGATKQIEKTYAHT